jgi:predicted XRE-type DNA-binding protein
MEVWVGAFEMRNQYEVSSLGNVRRKKSGRAVKTYKRSHGYRTFTPCVEGIIKTISVHKLIFQSFYGSIPPGMVINHKDCDGSNNAINNLELCTYAENLSHAVLNKRNNIYKSGLLKKEIVVKIYDSKMSHAKIAEFFKIKKSTVQRIKEKKIYRYHIGLEENSYAK